MGNSNSVTPGIVPAAVKVEKMKVLLVGPPLVGKSCIFKRYVTMGFHETYEPDLTANIGSKLVTIDGLPTINLELWDIPGTLDPNLEDIYFKDMDAAILVFDVANAKQSTEDVAKWHERLTAYEQRTGLGPLPKLKFGNKRDLIHGVLWHNYDTSKAPPRKGRRAKFAAFTTCPSFSVSAKDFGGLHSAFKQVIAEVYNHRHPIGGAEAPELQDKRGDADNISNNSNSNSIGNSGDNQAPSSDSAQPSEHPVLQKSSSEKSDPTSPDAGEEDAGSVESKSGSTAAAGQEL